MEMVPVFTAAHEQTNLTPGILGHKQRQITAHIQTCTKTANATPTP